MAGLRIAFTTVLLLAAPITSAAQVGGSPQIRGGAAAGGYAEALSQGHRASLAGDHAKALERYEAAKEMSPGEADAYYFIGYAQGRLKMFDEAVATLRTAQTIVGKKNADLSGKLLFLQAVLEEQRGDIHAAEKAWTEYLGFAQTHKGDRVFLGTAQKRLEAIKKKHKLDKEYVQVRKRLED